MPGGVARMVIARADGHCEAMIIAAGCTGRAEHLHHRKLRSQGGEHTVENVVHICHRCHRWIHHHPAQSYEWGLLVKGSHDPELVQVLRRGWWGFLSPQGLFEQTFDSGVDEAPFFHVDWS